jgi:predicted nucleic acid-binding protein
VAYLLDTNVLVRLANTADARYSVATQAVAKLHQQGETVHITPQVLIEFRNVATRAINLNGLGLTTQEAESKAVSFEVEFQLLVDTPDIYLAWKPLVEQLGIVGKQVHDARLVAICHVYDVSHLLTFNASHFARMAGFGPGVTIIDPKDV